MTNTYGTFSEVRARLDEILVEVRKKDLPLEKSLDLYEEAIKLANRCAELVDKSDFSKEEAQAASEILSQELNVNLGAQVSEGKQTGEDVKADESAQENDDAQLDKDVQVDKSVQETSETSSNQAKDSD